MSDKPLYHVIDINVGETVARFASENAAQKYLSWQMLASSHGYDIQKINEGESEPEALLSSPKTIKSLKKSL